MCRVLHRGPSTSFLRCGIAEDSWPAAQRPADGDAGKSWDSETILFGQDSFSRGHCRSGQALQRPEIVLDNGHTISVGGAFTCRSESWYLACVSGETGAAGFVMGRDFYKLVP